MDALGELFSDQPKLSHTDLVNLLSKHSESLEETLNKQFEHADREQIDEFLESANRTLNGHGVEDLIPEMNEPSLARYVNLGDTYDTTILYGIEEGKIFVCSWGAYYEETDWYKEYSKPDCCKDCSEWDNDCDNQEECSKQQNADKDENGLLIRCENCSEYIYNGKCLNCE